MMRKTILALTVAALAGLPVVANAQGAAGAATDAKAGAATGVQVDGTGAKLPAAGKAEIKAGTAPHGAAKVDAKAGAVKKEIKAGAEADTKAKVN